MLHHQHDHDVINYRQQNKSYSAAKQLVQQDVELD